MCGEKIVYDILLTFLLKFIGYVAYIQMNLKYIMEKNYQSNSGFQIPVRFTLNILGFVAILVIYIDTVNKNTKSLELVCIATLFMIFSYVLFLLCL